MPIEVPIAEEKEVWEDENESVAATIYFCGFSVIAAII